MEYEASLETRRPSSDFIVIMFIHLMILRVRGATYSPRETRVKGTKKDVKRERYKENNIVSSLFRGLEGAALLIAIGMLSYAFLVFGM